jgi:hypothetical protein
MKYENMPPNVSIGERIVKNPAHRAGLLDCRGKQNFNFHLLASTLPTRQGLRRAVAVIKTFEESNNSGLRIKCMFRAACRMTETF